MKEQKKDSLDTVRDLLVTAGLVLAGTVAMVATYAGWSPYSYPSQQQQFARTRAFAEAPSREERAAADTTEKQQTQSASPHK